LCVHYGTFVLFLKHHRGFLAAVILFWSNLLDFVIIYARKKWFLSHFGGNMLVGQFNKRIDWRKS